MRLFVMLAFVVAVDQYALDEAAAPAKVVDMSIVAT